MADLLEWLARRLVDDPEAVRVETEEREDAIVFHLHVAPDDVGKVIGKQGRIARALRSIVRAGGAYSQVLPRDFLFRAVVNAQYTNDLLVPGEQFGMGGAASVRGFFELRGFRLGGVKFEPYEGVAAGTVLRQFPLAGHPLTRRDAISLVVVAAEPTAPPL